jgi:hypothetical protein
MLESSSAGALMVQGKSGELDRQFNMTSDILDHRKHYLAILGSGLASRSCPGQ